MKAEVCGNGQEQQFLPLWSEYVICECVKKLGDGARIKKMPVNRFKMCFL